MYSEASMLALKKRIGFGDLSEDSVVIQPEHTTGTSGRTVPYFHRLAALDNLFASVSKSKTNTAKFNAYLLQMKTDAVKSVLTAIMELDKGYRDDVDYSDTLIQRPELFDDSIGYSLAISIIEQLVATSRINIEERNASLKYDKLKIELEGFRDEKGNVLAKGLRADLYRSMKKAAKIIFPNPLVVEALNDYW